jgi:hypothetical protein
MWDLIKRCQKYNLTMLFEYANLIMMLNGDCLPVNMLSTLFTCEYVVDIVYLWICCWHCRPLPLGSVGRVWRCWSCHCHSSPWTQWTGLTGGLTSRGRRSERWRICGGACPPVCSLGTFVLPTEYIHLLLHSYRANYTRTDVCCNGIHVT